MDKTLFDLRPNPELKKMVVLVEHTALKTTLFKNVLVLLH
jgi:hypothetical protein